MDTPGGTLPSMSGEGERRHLPSPGPSSCSRWPRWVIWAGGRPGISLLVGVEGPKGVKAGSLGSSLGMQWPEVIPCDRLSAVQLGCRVAPGHRCCCPSCLPLREQKEGRRWQLCMWGACASSPLVVSELPEVHAMVPTADNRESYLDSDSARMEKKKTRRP